MFPVHLKATVYAAIRVQKMAK